MTEILNIIHNSEKKRHENHVNAGKNIKENWIKQGIQEGKKEVIDFIKTKKIVYNSNVTPPIYEYQLTEEDLKKIEEKNGK